MNRTTSTPVSAGGVIAPPVCACTISGERCRYDSRSGSAYCGRCSPRNCACACASCDLSGSDRLRVPLSRSEGNRQETLNAMAKAKASPGSSLVRLVIPDEIFVSASIAGSIRCFHLSENCPNLKNLKASLRSATLCKICKKEQLEQLSASAGSTLARPPYGCRESPATWQERTGLALGTGSSMTEPTSSMAYFVPGDGTE